MTDDLRYTQYRLTVVLLMPAGHDRNVQVAAITYRLAVLTGVIR